MIRSLWIAKTGLDAQQINMDVIANNLANVSTNGFKRSRAVFEDLMYQTMCQPGTQSSEQTTLPSGLQIGTCVRPVTTERLHTQGNLSQTSNSKDIAINGQGYFQIQMPDGTSAYTRDGAFQVDQNGQLVTNSGFPVQSGITIPANATSITVARDGVVSVTQVGQLTQAASQQSGIPHHLILAQAALESGWGQRQILIRDGKPSYNVFCIKASGDWKGDTTDIMTTEYEQGEAKKVRASFRVYNSYFEALTDYVKLISNNPRYAAVANASSAEQGAQALQAAGHATDPKYAQKLVGMIQQFKNMSDKVVKAYSQDLGDLF
ncbi:flagellar assembly peptidoglycan hydrolase FlgJ [Pantoea sp. Eser]|nr:flagellar assembly peptidoglycan hydrolase FlgJ [Pantoea sp. Eser]